MTKTRYTFRPAALTDLPLLRGWHQHPHVRAWWEEDAPFEESDLHDPRVALWIVECAGNPFAYMQDYDVHGWEGHHFAHLPPGSRGIDQYIGERTMLGLGHGQRFIRQRMQALFAAGAPAIGVDPHPANARAIAVYEKVGFRVTGAARATDWGQILPMEAWAEGA